MAVFARAFDARFGARLGSASLWSRLEMAYGTISSGAVPSSTKVFRSDNLFMEVMRSDKEISMVSRKEEIRDDLGKRRNLAAENFNRTLRREFGPAAYGVFLAKNVKACRGVRAARVMSSASAATLSLLEQSLGRVPFYQNVARLRQDMQGLFYNCATLRPNVGSFQSPTGTIVLFYLSGVIPITYNGANYNIPVTIYIDPPYPNQPPRIFVTPTSDMMIKSNHKSVDSNGRVYLPELTRWNPYSSNLVSIIGILSSVFSSEPPVHAVRSPGPQVLTAQVINPPGMSRRDILINSLTVKLRAKLPARVKTEVDELNRAREAENVVKANNTRIKKAQADLINLRVRMETEIEALIALDAQNREWIKKNSADASDAAPNSTSALSYLEAESVVGQQVIDLMAEECAHEDLMDYLCALNRDGKLSMSDLLKEIRVLTRKLFEIRTLKRRSLVVLQSGNSMGNALKVPSPPAR